MTDRTGKDQPPPKFLMLNDLMASTFTTGWVYLKSDGMPWRSSGHVRDIMLDYAAALEASREPVHDQEVDIGTTAGNDQIQERVELVPAVVPVCRIESVAGAGPDARCDRSDFNPIARLKRIARVQALAAVLRVDPDLRRA